MPWLISLLKVIINIPHFHAGYGEFNGVFRIDNLEMIEGDLPTRARTLVFEWAGKYQKDLMGIWNDQIFKQLPGLD
jgi:hypothetical protein